MAFTGEAEKGSLDGGPILERTIGAAIAVHEALGPGLQESVYAKAMDLELSARKIPFSSEVHVSLEYRGQAVGEGRLDLLIENTLVVELKAVESLLAIHTAQLITYLKMTGHPLGLLINFNVPLLKQGLRRVTHPRLYHSKRP